MKPCGSQPANPTTSATSAIDVDVDGSEIGDAAYALLVRPGDLISTLDGTELRVTALVPLENEHSPYTALLQVESA